MRYEVFNLKEYFPGLQNGDPEKLAGQRRAFARETDIDMFDWSVYRQPTLTAYIPDNSSEIDLNRTHPCVLICPGGGYTMVSFREGEPLALSFMARGFNAFVLDYEVAPVRYPAALLQVSAAAALIRAKAKEFHADADKVAVCGFSAGGHLAGSLGVFWNDPFIRETLSIENGANRPNALILGYPVITAGESAHRGSFESLLGDDAPAELVEKMALEKQVNVDVPPTFLWHTSNDDCVPVENSLLFAGALTQFDIPFELHIYPKGNHGLSLCSRQTDAAGNTDDHVGSWFGLCCEWLELTLGF
jgi:acetyl esterase/lipase